MKRIFKFNESQMPDDDLILTNLFNFYMKKYPEDGDKRFFIMAGDLVGEGDISQEALDEFCEKNELDKDSLEFDPKTKKFKKRKAATKAKRTEVKVEYRDMPRGGC